MKWSDIQAGPATDAPAPAAEPPKRMKWSDLTQGSPGTLTPPGDARERSGETAQPGLFQRMWDGLSGKDVSRAGRFGMGVGDPVLGIGQMAAKAGSAQAEMEGAIGAAGTQEKLPPAMASASGDLDKAIQQREAGYQQREKAAGLGGFSSEWARLLGNVASPPNLAIGGVGGAAARGLGLAGRLGASTAMGAASGAMEPVASGDFGKEKAKQAGFGAVGGLAGGAAGEGVSKLAAAIVGNSPQMIDQLVTNRYRQAVRPKAGVGWSAPRMDAQDRRMLDAVDDILKNKASLKLTDAANNEVTGQLPTNLRQFAEAVDQRKTAIFDEYDKLAVDAGKSAAAQPNRHLPEFTESSRRAADAQRRVTQAERAVTAAAAKQSRAGDNVYSTSIANDARRQADAALARAQRSLTAAERRKESSKEMAYSVRVDVDPMVKTMRDFARRKEVKDLHPQVAADVESEADRFASIGSYTPKEAQEIIKTLNREAKSFWTNPQPGLATRAGGMLEAARALRESLDETITKASGPGYQALRDRYGALASIEADVAKAAQRKLANTPGGIGAMFTDVGTVVELLHGLVDPTKLPRAGGYLAAKQWLKWTRDPNVAVSRLFRTRDAGAAGKIGSAVGDFTQQAAPAFGGIGGGLAGAAAERPALGKPRPSVIGP